MSQAQSHLRDSIGANLANISWVSRLLSVAATIVVDVRVRDPATLSVASVSYFFSPYIPINHVPDA